MNQDSLRGGQQRDPKPTADSLAGPRPPDYVSVLWASEQLRQRIQRNNAALAQEIQDRGRRRHGRKAEPKAELEAEP